MAAIPETLRGMRPGAKKPYFAAMALAGLLLAADAQAQFIPVRSGTNFSAVIYCEPPHEQQVKERLSGAEMSSLPGTLYDVKELRIETFGTNGAPVAVVEAPQCIYAPLDGEANSPGHLEMNLDDGKIRVQGEGFLWQQNESSLVISNQQRTVIKMGAWKLTTP
jgi:hypothetical protein